MTKQALTFGAAFAALIWSLFATVLLYTGPSPEQATWPALAVPISGIAFAAMHAVCHRESRTGMRVANAAGWSLFGLSVVGYLYGGWYVIPALLLLIVAAGGLPAGWRGPGVNV